MSIGQSIPNQTAGPMMQLCQNGHCSIQYGKRGYWRFPCTLPSLLSLRCPCCHPLPSLKPPLLVLSHWSPWGLASFSCAGWSMCIWGVLLGNEVQDNRVSSKFFFFPLTSSWGVFKSIRCHLSTMLRRREAHRAHSPGPKSLGRQFIEAQFKNTIPLDYCHCCGLFSGQAE